MEILPWWHFFRSSKTTVLEMRSYNCGPESQIKSLLLSHHHSTSALVSEILMSVLQTVQKNNRQFTYGQTVQKTALEHLQCSRQCKKKQQQQFTYGQTVQKSNSNLHMDSTCLQTVQKTMCKIHIHILSTHSVL